MSVINNPMARRIFIAIPISQKLRNKVFDWQKKFQPDFGKSNKIIRWLPEKNLHITLIPPWDEENPKKIAESLDKISGKFSPFEIRFDKINYGPDPIRPRLIWAWGRNPRMLSELKSKLENIPETPRGKRPFTLHLTLARFNPEDFNSFALKKLNEKVDWHETVDSIVLIESHLSSYGADYKILKKISL